VEEMQEVELYRIYRVAGLFGPKQEMEFSGPEGGYFLKDLTH